jgi:ABC-2 type transport system ATP-binding protein
VARFGAVLHVSSPDAAGLEAAIARHPGQWRKLEGGPEGGLEEAFIWLMSGAQDNFGAQPSLGAAK